LHQQKREQLEQIKKNNGSNEEEARRTTIPNTGNAGVTTKSAYPAQVMARDRRSYPATEKRSRNQDR